MPILELFSKRKRKLESAGQAVIYQYDEIPKEFRNQVWHIWKNAIGTDLNGNLGRATAIPF
jgi:hypothetical protein